MNIYNVKWPIMLGYINLSLIKNNLFSTLYLQNYINTVCVFHAPLLSCYQTSSSTYASKVNRWWLQCLLQFYTYFLLKRFSKCDTLRFQSSHPQHSSTLLFPILHDYSHSKQCLSIQAWQKLKLCFPEHALNTYDR